MEKILKEDNKVEQEEEGSGKRYCHYDFVPKHRLVLEKKMAF